MLRVLSIGGLAGGFLAISPSLRADVTRGYEKFAQLMSDFCPWSFVAVGLVIFALVTIELYRFAMPAPR